MPVLWWRWIKGFPSLIINLLPRFGNTISSMIQIDPSPCSSYSTYKYSIIFSDRSVKQNQKNQENVVCHFLAVFTAFITSLSSLNQALIINAWLRLDVHLINTVYRGDSEIWKLVFYEKIKEKIGKNRKKSICCYNWCSDHLLQAVKQ